MIKYIDKGTARQHLTDRLIESALANVGFREDADAVFLDIAKNRLPVWLDELDTYEVAEVKRGRWIADELGYTSLYTCSVCGHRIMHGEVPEWHYCPNCGSHMENEDE